MRTAPGPIPRHPSSRTSQPSRRCETKKFITTVAAMESFCRNEVPKRRATRRGASHPGRWRYPRLETGVVGVADGWCIRRVFRGDVVYCFICFVGHVFFAKEDTCFLRK